MPIKLPKLKKNTVGRQKIKEQIHNSCLKFRYNLDYFLFIIKKLAL